MGKQVKVVKILIVLFVLFPVFSGCIAETPGDSGNTKNSTDTPQEIKSEYIKKLGKNAPIKSQYASAVVNGKLYIMVDASYIDEDHPETFLNTGRLFGYDPQADAWIEKARLPEMKIGYSILELNGKLYALGGIYIDNKLLSPDYDFSAEKHDVYNPERIYNDSLRFTATVHEYDPASDKWTAKASMNINRSNPAYIKENGLIFAIGGAKPKDGGYEGAGTVEAYNPANDQWVIKNSMPKAIEYTPQLASANGTIFVTHFIPPTFESYDISSDEWITYDYTRDLPSSPYFFDAKDDILYFVDAYGNLKSYEIDIRSWEKINNLKDYRGDAAAVLSDGKIFNIGGMNGTNSSSLSTSAWYYDIDQNIWLEMENLEERKWSMSLSVLDGAIYVIGGRGEYNDGGNEYFDTVEIYYKP